MTNISTQKQIIKYKIERSTLGKSKTLDLLYEVHYSYGKTEKYPAASGNDATLEESIFNWRNELKTNVDSTYPHEFEIFLDPGQSASIRQCSLNFQPLDYIYSLHLQRPLRDSMKFITKFPPNYEVVYQFDCAHSSDTRFCDTTKLTDGNNDIIRRARIRGGILPYQGIICEWRPSL